MIIPPDGNHTTVKERYLLIFAVILASAAVHSPALFVERWLNVLSARYDIPSLDSSSALYFVDAVRALFFLGSVFVVIWFFARPVLDFLVQKKSAILNKQTLLAALAVFGCSAVLVFPSRLGIMGAGYAEMSRDPFGFRDATGQIYQRLLLPGLAYFLQFKGAILYHLFSLILTYGLMLCTLMFLRSRETQTSLLENISIAGSSFIITQLQSPGYTEQLSIIIILLMVTVPLGFLPRIAGVALALFAHEVSILLLIPIGLLYFSKEEKIWSCFVVFVYGIFWLASFGLDPVRLMAVRTVGGASGLAWLIGHPLRELGGLAVSYKLLWGVIALALFQPGYRKEILFFLLPGIAATMFGVDTSRLMAFSALSCLIAVVAVKKLSLIPERYLQLLFGLNLCLPSVYIGLNSGLVYFNGLYQLVYRGFFLQ